MSKSNKVGFVLLVLLVGAAVALCAPPPKGEPTPDPSPSTSSQLRTAPQSAPSPAVTS